jgi:hypothetical protein
MVGGLCFRAAGHGTNSASSPASAVCAVARFDVQRQTWRLMPMVRWRSVSLTLTACQSENFSNPPLPFSSAPFRINSQSPTSFDIHQ